MSRSLEHVLNLSDPDWIALERVVAHFEAAWRQGIRPAIDEHVPSGPAIGPVALIELVHAELEFRLEAGEPARVEDYLRRFPELARDREALCALIAAEAGWRRPRESGLALRDYLDRFPGLRDDLAAHWRDAAAEPDDSGRPSPHPGLSPGPLPDDPAGRGRPAGPRLGKFELLEEIGRGSFGVVHRARDVQLDRDVALKVPRPGRLATREAADLFLREARSAARLCHPGIVAIYEAGLSGETSYIASEMVSGTTLADRLGAVRPDPRAAAELAADVAEALHHAHQHGVIHRDLKPSNILLDRDGRPHVADFGLARQVAGESTLTLDGQVIGTPAYMSPEQARGEAHRVDGRSDVYSLGVILYQLLTGELPFRGHPRMILDQVLDDEPTAPRGLDVAIPRDLETIVLKAMAREPARRYASAGALAEDLRRFLRGEPILARPVGVCRRGLRWAGRRPAIAILAALLALASALGIGGVVWGWRRSEAARRDLEANRYARLVALADGALAAEDIGRARQLLDECPPALRGWEWHFLKHRCRRAPLDFRGHTGLIFGVAFSPDGSRLASAGGDETVRIWDASSGRETHVLRGHAGAVHAVAFSPDGSRLASAGGDGSIRLWDAIVGREVRALRVPSELIRDVAYSPDGRRLASGDDDGSVRIWDAASGAEVMTLSGHTGRVTCVAFRPDGACLASAGGDGTVRVWDARTGRESQTLRSAPAAAIACLAYSPDGRRLASGDGDGAVRIWDVRAGREEFRLRGHEGDVLGVAYHPAGTRLATTGADGAVRVWDVGGRREALALRGHRHVVWGVAFSPDGRRLASGGAHGVLKLWDAATLAEAADQAVLVLRGSTGVVGGVTFSPDGRLVASGGGGGALQLWEAATGREVAPLLGHSGGVTGVAFGPVGARLASAGVDGTVRVWDVEARREVIALRSRPLTAITGVAFGPDGARLASAGVDGTVRVWDVGSRREVLTLRGHADAVQAVAFHPDGRRLASGGRDRTARIWDAATGRALAILRGHDDFLESLAFSPDGRRLASAGRDGAIRVWDAETGGHLRTLGGRAGITLWGLAFSPDGRRLASGAGDGTVTIWDVAGGREVHILRGHAGAVHAVAFSPAGDRLASAGWDRTIRIWESGD